MRNWAKIINKWPWLVVAGTLVAVMAAAGYGFGVFGKLTGGRDVDRQAESSKVAATVAAKFKGQDYQLIGLFTSGSATVGDSGYKQAVESRVKQIQAHAHVKTVVDFYNTGNDAFVSKNRRQTYVAVSLDGTKAQNTAVFRDLAATPAPTGFRLAYGGEVAVTAQINDQISHDLEFAELISFPLLAILLFLVFRSLAATLAPLAIGGMSIVGAFALVRVLSNFTNISVYSINVITIMGLGLAIDYSLFVISRFREELAAGRAAPDAVANTLATAGRTVLFSGLTVMLCLLSLLVFPLDFLHSMALGGSAAVLAAVTLATTILPAALRLLGHRINWLSLGRGHKTARAVESGRWYRLARFVMRRPVITLAVALAVLLALGSPFLSAKFSMPTDDIVPKNLSSRAVGDDLKNNFANPGTLINILITAHPQLSAAAVDATRTYLDEIRAVSGVKSVTDIESTVGTNDVISAYAAQILRIDSEAAPARAAFVSGDVQLVKVYTDYAPQSKDAQNLVAALRNAAPVPGITTQIGGESAELVDLLHSLGSKIPLAAGLILVAITVLLLLMLGSVVIPLKAVILNALSLSAAFGLLVWIFQDGHFADALNLVALGQIDAMQPILIFATAFGLAMDYELFLVSRIKEAYDTGISNEEATAIGVEKTAGIITSAALLLVVVIGAFATSRVTIIEQVGVGLAAAVIIDATIVRLVLLPASMRLLGRWNWWAPAPLVRLRSRLGLKEEV